MVIAILLFVLYLLEMTTTENEHPITLTTREGIYLLEMTTIENSQSLFLLVYPGIYLLEMTATENIT